MCLFCFSQPGFILEQSVCSEHASTATSIQLGDASAEKMAGAYALKRLMKSPGLWSKHVVIYLYYAHCNGDIAFRFDIVFAPAFRELAHVSQMLATQKSVLT